MNKNDLENNNIEQLLKEALNSELRAKEFYKNAHKKAKSKAGKQLFMELAEFEQSHFEKVKKIIESQNSGRKIDVGEISSKKLEIKSEIEGEFEPNKNEIIDVIYLAIESEKKAHDIYRKISNMFKDEIAKKIFDNLAQDEVNHQRILEDELYQLSNKGTIFWD
jgi:rubrerythrin